jgi:hypothetical protein
MDFRSSRRQLFPLGGLLLMVIPAGAQDVPWEIFTDASSASACEVINTNNVELVLLRATSELTIVTARDVTLIDTEVDGAGNVYFEGEPVGFITYDFDGDGFRTLWWVSLTGFVVDVDGFTGQPTETDRVPADFENVGCDACDYWDDQSICGATPEPEPEPPVVPIFNLCGGGMLSTSLMLGLTLTLVKANRRRVDASRGFRS